MRIQAVDRAISILDLFKGSRDPLGISEIATALGLVKTTVHGLVSTLEKNGFLQKDLATRKYRLGFALYELSTIQMSHLEINQRATIPLQHLSNRISRVCRVAIWDRDSIIATMTVRPQGYESATREFGPRLPGYCTALGKAILANMPASERKDYLDRTELIAYTPNTITDRQVLEEDLILTHEQGYSVSRQEVFLHHVGLGAPVFASAGRVAGAINARLSEEDQDTDFMASTAKLVMQTAYQISLDMGYQPVEM